MNRAAFAVASVLFGLSSLLPADVLSVSASGTFSSTTPTTSWEAPGETWSLSFQINSNPTVTRSYVGAGFDAPLSNFVYQLNGSTVNVGPVDDFFASSTQGGAFNLCFLGCTAAPALGLSEGFSFASRQYYSGPESDPSIITNGSFSVSAVAFYPSTPPAPPGTVEPNAIITITDLTQAPEPSTLCSLIAGGAFWLALKTRSRRKSTTA